MAFKKIPKEDWDKMTLNEQHQVRLEFDKSVEQRIKSTVIATRIIAIFLIIALFFIGFAQLKAVNEYGKLKDQYGSQAWCYLCGLEEYKKCECQYFSDYNEKILDDLKNYSKSIAEYNIQDCRGMKVQDGSYQYAGYFLNLSNLTN